MKRRELLQRIAALPPDADVGVQIGDDHLDISDVVAWGDGTLGALRCHRGDLRDLFRAWEAARIDNASRGDSAAFIGALNIDGVA
jgi:hypothetical protein